MATYDTETEINYLRSSMDKMRTKTKDLLPDAQYGYKEATTAQLDEAHYAVGVIQAAQRQLDAITSDARGSNWWKADECRAEFQAAKRQYQARYGG